MRHFVVGNKRTGDQDARLFAIISGVERQRMADSAICFVLGFASILIEQVGKTTDDLVLFQQRFRRATISPDFASAVKNPTEWFCLPRFVFEVFGDEICGLSRSF